jgi:hypothetical protein
LIIELLTVFAVLTGGCALVRAAGIGGWALPALGYLAGTALLILIGTVQVVTPLPTAPLLTLALTAAIPVAWWAGRLRAGHEVAVPWRWAVLVVVAVAAAVGVLRAAHLVKWSVDSFKYVMAGSLLASGEYDSGADLSLLTKRLLAAPLIHAPANLGGEYYLRSVIPLLALATVGTLAWLVLTGLRGRLARGSLAGFAALAVLLLVSTNRFVFHAFYVNGHLLFAALLLLIAGCGWLLVSDTGVPARALTTLQLIAVPALVVTRAEGWLVAGLALLPTLLSGRTATRHRAALLATLGAATAAWHGYVAVALHARDESATMAAGQAALGVVLVLLAAVALRPPMLRAPEGGRWLPRRASAGGRWLPRRVPAGGRWLPRRVPAGGRWLPAVVEGGLWLALVAFAVRQPAVLWDSAVATVRNVALGAGGWGLSLVVLSLLVLGALGFARVPHQAHLRFAVTTFVPLGFLLAHLRGIAYRVGEGDSLNRMFIQVVPLAILYVVVAVASGQPRRTQDPRDLAFVRRQSEQTNLTIARST